MTVANGKVTGSLQFIEGGLAPSGPLAGDGYFLALKWSNPQETVTSLKVGIIPSQGSGLVEAIDDTDRNGVFKVTDKTSQDIVIIQRDGKNTNTQTLDLSGLTLEEVQGA